MARPGIVYDFWNSFIPERLTLEDGVRYVALGTHRMGADVTASLLPGLLLGEDHGLPGRVGEPLEHCSVLPPEQAAARRVLLVHRLPGDPELLGDLLPRPALVARVLDLERLQAFDERAQGPDG